MFIVDNYNWNVIVKQNKDVDAEHFRLGCSCHLL